MTDKELLKLAAKAAGKDHVPHKSNGDEWRPMYSVWNPLTDDGDALRLAVRLDMDLEIDSDRYGSVLANRFRLLSKDDPYAATRRAIVRAAAEVGKNL